MVIIDNELRVYLTNYNPTFQLIGITKACMRVEMIKQGYMENEDVNGALQV